MEEWMKAILKAAFFIFLNVICYGQGENLFDGLKVIDVKITSYTSNTWDTIVSKYYAKEYTPVRIEIDGDVIDSVGIRIKGNSFSPEYMPQERYQAFRLKFGEFRDGQKYDGLKQVNLHNHDLLENLLSYNLFQNSDLICPRTNFAKLWFDNKLIGIYMFVDEYDKTFLKRNYNNNDGNLFKADDKGAYLNWLGHDPNLYAVYELETNEEQNDKTDLINFLYSIHHSSDLQLVDSLKSYLNLDAFMKSLAIEALVCKGDAFYDSGHNYFLYHNSSTNKFEYLPWDMDVSFGFIFYLDFSGMHNEFLNKILSNEYLKGKYYSNVCEMINNSIFDIDRLIALIESTENMLQNRELSFENGKSDVSISHVKEYIRNRKSQILSEFIKYGYDCNPNSVAEESIVFDVYPNPANDFINIEINESVVDEYVDIYNLYGERIFRQFIDKYKNINISKLDAGVYLLKYGSFNKIFIKQ